MVGCKSERLLDMVRQGCQIMKSAMVHRGLCLFIAAAMLAGARLSIEAGNIDNGGQGAKFAYGENVGWINLAPASGPGVTVESNSLSGYGWGENVGWINFSPPDGGVINDGSGNLTGWAWGENIGWINFSPTGGGVKINPATGSFSGYAWGENVGWVNFDTDDSSAVTTWRAASGDSQGGGGGGGCFISATKE